MKKFALYILLIFCTYTNAQTNRTGTTSVTGTFGGDMSMPVMVTNKFITDYPNIAPTWSMEDDNYAAQYREETSNLAHVVVYDRFGNLVRKDVEVEKTAHPKTVCSYYSKHYPEEKYILWKSEDADGKISYYSKHEAEVICFDKTGKYVSTKAKKAVQATEKSK